MRQDSRPGQTNWREILLNRVHYVILGVFGVSGLLTVTLVRTDALRRAGVVVLILAVVLYVVLSQTRIAYVWRAWITVGAVFLASTFAYLTVGFNPGSVLSAGLCIVLAALLLGKRAMIGALAGFMTLTLTMAWAVWIGIWEGPSPADMNAADPLIWLRTAVLSAVFWGSTAMSVMFVIGNIEGGLERRDSALREKASALARLEEEVSQRREAESARREAIAMAHQAQKLEAVGRLAAGVAHDFNNALLVIQGWNDIRGLDDRDDNQRNATQAIDKAARQSGQLARQLLTFARKDVRAPTYLAADRVVVEMAKTLQRLLRAGIKLKVDTQPGTTVYADEAQLQQLLLNLVLNARDALVEDGEIRLRVYRATASQLAEPAAGRPRDGQWVVIEVEDDGIGMNEETSRHVFEPFFTTKETGRGTGLGLSTVFGIVEQSGGHVHLDSQLDRGTCVCVYLPAVPNAPDESHQEAGVDETARINARVLVLEDDPLARELIVNSLQCRGVVVVSTDDGDAALTTLRGDPKPFDILCCDAVFPGAALDDVLAAFEVHSPGARILICSGYVQQELAIRGVESGAYGFLAKPFTTTQLTAKIQAML